MRGAGWRRVPDVPCTTHRVRWPLAHPRNKTRHIFLVRMEGIASYGMHLSRDVIAFSIQIHAATGRIAGLEGPGPDSVHKGMLSWRAMPITCRTGW